MEQSPQNEAACPKCEECPKGDENEQDSELYKALNVRRGYPGAWEPSLPETVMRRSIAHEGDLIRLDECFLKKVLIDNKPVTVAALGSSITELFACYRGHYLNPRLNPDWQTDKGFIGGPLEWLYSLLPDLPVHPRSPFNATGREEPAAPFNLHNLGVGGRSVEYLLDCVGQTMLNQLPNDVDLFTIDYNIVPSESFLNSMEHLIQWILARPHPAAIVFINYNHWCKDNSFHPGGGCLGTAENWTTMAETFSEFKSDEGEFARYEENITALAQYYSIPVISMRDALFPLLATGQKNSWDFHRGDGHHPTPEQADTIYNDIVRYFFFRQARSFWERRSRNEGDQTFAEYRKGTPPILVPQSHYFQKMYTKACFSFEVGKPPKSASFIKSPVLSAKGWELNDDVDSPKPKRGLITREPGRVVEFEFDTASLVPRNMRSGGPIDGTPLLTVWYLESYERMGLARVECISRCSCDNITINATTDERVSIGRSVDIFLENPTKKCRVALTSMEGAGGTKFKILSVELMFY